MISDPIIYFNNRLTALGYFNEVLCLAEKIEKEGKAYPAIYNTNNEYQNINLDSNGSLCYWRKNGDVSISGGASETSIGTQYTTTVPLKLVGFIKKEESINDQYFADNICLSIISNLTVNNSALKSMLKAKKATLTSVKYVTDPRTVASDEYDNVPFEARYTHAYFSIDFVLVFVTNSQCYADLCESLPFDWGYVTVTDGETVTQVHCGTSYTCAGGGVESVIVNNSNNSYSETISENLTLPDESFDVYVNGVLNTSFTYIPLSGEDINITG